MQFSAINSNIDLLINQIFSSLISFYRNYMLTNCHINCFALKKKTKTTQALVCIVAIFLLLLAAFPT